jgi:hypothetical protein
MSDVGPDMAHPYSEFYILYYPQLMLDMFHMYVLSWKIF